MLVKKNILIMHPTDNGACSFYRCRFMAMILQSQLAGEVEVIVSPAEINDDYVLAHTAAIIVYRPYTDEHVTLIRNYGRKKNKLKYRIFADYDDVIWNVFGKSLIPEYNGSGIDTDMATMNIHRMLQYLDGVTVSTYYLEKCFNTEFQKLHPYFNSFARVLPNAMPRYLFGQERRRIKEDLKKPVVLYGGSSTHYKDGEYGDFDGGLVEWLSEKVVKNQIELHMFDVPWFLKNCEGKIFIHDKVSALEYPSVASSIHPDFYLAPLKENDFNRAKSNLKLLEATALGAVLLGSVFPDSPYNDAPLSRMKGTFEDLLKADIFNGVLNEQYMFIDNNNLWMDSMPYIHRFLRTYFGNDIKANF